MYKSENPPNGSVKTFSNIWEVFQRLSASIAFISMLYRGFSANPGIMEVKISYSLITTCWEN